MRAVASGLLKAYKPVTEAVGSPMCSCVFLRYQCNFAYFCVTNPSDAACEYTLCVCVCRFDDFMPSKKPSLVVLPIPLDGTVFDYTFDKASLGYGTDVALLLLQSDHCYFLICIV